MIDWWLFSSGEQKIWSTQLIKDTIGLRRKRHLKMKAWVAPAKRLVRKRVCSGRHSLNQHIYVSKCWENRMENRLFLSMVCEKRLKCEIHVFEAYFCLHWYNLNMRVFANIQLNLTCTKFDLVHSSRAKLHARLLNTNPKPRLPAQMCKLNICESSFCDNRKCKTRKIRIFSMTFGQCVRYSLCYLRTYF